MNEGLLTPLVLGPCTLFESEASQEDENRRSDAPLSENTLCPGYQSTANPAKNEGQ
jgi:hypothetical protein